MAKESKELLAKIRERFRIMKDADEPNRRAAMLDLKFALVPGEQWDVTQKTERGERPCYEFNKIRVTGKRIVNDMRANRPQGKVRAVEDGDKPTADAMEGLIRNIWNVSDGDTIIDYAAEYQVFAGMGAWRVSVDYSDDTSFTQDIRVEALRNPFCLYADPASSDPIKRDAQDWILTDKISATEYARRWPKAKVESFEDDSFDDQEDWDDGETVRICEYWYKKPVTKRLLLLEDGRTVEDEGGELDSPVKQTRVVNTQDVYMCIASGSAILEGPTKWAGRQFPFVMIFGEWVVIDGKPQWMGITRFAKDPQRSYNVARTAVTETIAAAPQAKFWATPAQAEGHVGLWAEAHKKLYPFMMYNPDPSAPGEPQRMGGAEVPVALIQEAQIASDEIKAVTGIFDASLGNRSNEQSGIAIRARQAQGEIATFNYSDNMAKGIRRTWEILVDLVPKIYDTERTIRVLGVDGAENYVKVNSVEVDPQTGTLKPLNDITRGRYDVAITVGPAFSTQRQEAAEIYTQMVQANPALFPIAGDLIMRSLDLPYADKMAERMKTLLPPAIQEMEASKKPVPPEVRAAMQQAEQAMAMAQQHSQLVQAAASELEQEKAAADKAKNEVKLAVAEFEVKRAEFERDVAKALADIAKRDADSAMKQGETDSANDRESLALEVQQAVAQIQQMAAQFMQAASQTLAEIQAKQQTQVIVPHKPRIVQMHAQRVNGALVATPVYEDQIAQ